MSELEATDSGYRGASVLSSGDWRTLLLVVTVVVALTSALAAAYLRLDVTNPFDEHAHLDYLLVIADQGRIPDTSATLTQETLREFACRGQAFAGLECGAPVQDPTRAPFSGESYQTVYPPTYYLLTAVPTRVLHTAVPGISWLDAGRLASTLWLVSGAALASVLALRLRATVPAALAAGVGLGGTPLMLSQGAALSSDVAAVTMSFATVLVWLALTKVPTATRLGITGYISVLALTLKPTALAAVIVVAVLEQRWQALRQGPLKSLTAPAVWAVCVGAIYLAVAAIDNWMRGGGPMVTPELRSLLEGYGFSVGSLLTSSYASTLSGTWWWAGSPLGDVSSWWDDYLGTPFMLLTILVAAVTTVGLVTAAVGHPRPWRGSEADAVRWGSLAALAALPAVLIAGQVLSGLPAIWQDRFLMPAGALGLVGISAALRGRWALAAAGVVGTLWLWAVISLIVT